MFAIAGENLTKRLRSKAFQVMLSQEVAWFDEPDNNVGSLCTRLAVEASAVQGVKKILKLNVIKMVDIACILIIQRRQE